MFSKRAVVVSTSAGAGTRSAIKDVCDALLYLGIPYVMKYGIAVQAMKWDDITEKKKEKIDNDTTKIAKKLSTNKKPRVAIKTKILFNIMGMMQKKDGGHLHPKRNTGKKKDGLMGKGHGSYRHKMHITKEGEGYG
jgi:hypothetical protein